MCWVQGYVLGSMGDVASEWWKFRHGFRQFQKYNIIQNSRSALLMFGLMFQEFSLDDEGRSESGKEEILS